MAVDVDGRRAAILETRAGKGPGRQQGKQENRREAGMTQDGPDHLDCLAMNADRIRLPKAMRSPFL
ncbi:MAG: hypothetical protein E5V33_27460 [Mesorhizobium sp.]|nr:MAG: hypothetical protein E5W25_21175 [Mesorhizobium sp.]TIX17217.1 MAG: hypothetical protein E5V44_04360 [Mesorhizobium sp.]TIX53056.1 MAG: hypothetical protein E5V33_27460 [Mesorhizobium sp.]